MNFVNIFVGLGSSFEIAINYYNLAPKTDDMYKVFFLQ